MRPLLRLFTLAATAAVLAGCEDRLSAPPLVPVDGAASIAPLSVAISGADSVSVAGGQLYAAVTSGGDSHYTYLWERSVSGGAWKTVDLEHGVLNLCAAPGDAYPFRLRVTVTSAGQRASSTLDGEVRVPGEGPGPLCEPSGE